MTNKDIDPGTGSGRRIRTSKAFPKLSSGKRYSKLAGVTLSPLSTIEQASAAARCASAGARIRIDHSIYIGPDVDFELIRFACVTRRSKLLVLAWVVDPPTEEMAPIVQKVTEALLPISTVVLGGSPP